MAQNEDEKRRLIEELSHARVQIAGSAALIQEKLDLRHRAAEVGQRIGALFNRYSWSWLSIAAVFGWILSRLPVRKEKVYLGPGAKKLPKPRPSLARTIGVSIWNGIWSVARPILTAYLTRKLAMSARRAEAR